MILVHNPVHAGAPCLRGVATRFMIDDDVGSIQIFSGARSALTRLVRFLPNM